MGPSTLGSPWHVPRVVGAWPGYVWGGQDSPKQGVAPGILLTAGALPRWGWW